MHLFQENMPVRGDVMHLFCENMRVGVGNMHFIREKMRVVGDHMHVVGDKIGKAEANGRLGWNIAVLIMGTWAGRTLLSGLVLQDGMGSRTGGESGGIASRVARIR